MSRICRVLRRFWARSPRLAWSAWPAWSRAGAGGRLLPVGERAGRRSAAVACLGVTVPVAGCWAVLGRCPARLHERLRRCRGGLGWALVGGLVAAGLGSGLCLRTPVGMSPGGSFRTLRWWRIGGTPGAGRGEPATALLKRWRMVGPVNRYPGPAVGVSGGDPDRGRLGDTGSTRSAPEKRSRYVAVCGEHHSAPRTVVPGPGDEHQRVAVAQEDLQEPGCMLLRERGACPSAALWMVRSCTASRRNKPRRGRASRRTPERCPPW